MTNELQLSAGQAISGKVTSVQLYGALIKISEDQEALLHISQFGDTNVRNVDDMFKVGDDIEAYILKVYRDTGRIALTMVKPPEVPWESIKVGNTYPGKVTRLENFGVFVDFGAERPGMVHVSEMAEGFIQSPSDVVKEGQDVEVRVIKVNRKKRQIDLSMKPERHEIEQIDFEDSDEPVLNAMQEAFRRAGLK
ncbi:hypothetical protein MASR2M15_14890 [Anaerolineales bacterium]